MWNCKEILTMKTSVYTFLGLFAVVLFLSSWGLIDGDGKAKNMRKKQKDEISCSECHSDLTINKYKHNPAVESCSNCHSSNGNSHPKSDNNEFTLADTPPTLCFYCHEENSKANIHSPAKEGECVMCHSPHSSKYNNLLTDKVPNLCFNCHEAFDKKTSHAPVSEGECFSCHSAHESDNSKLLVEKETSDLCLMCHDLEIEENHNVHAAMEMGSCIDCHNPHHSDNTGLLNESKPQLCVNCHDNIKEQIELKHPHAAAVDDCSNCHAAHSSKNSSLLTENVPTLCFSCHEAFDKKHGHSPVSEGDCLSCHTVHGSDNRKLLTEKESSNLCLMCHDLEMENSKVQHAPVIVGECTDCHNPHHSEQYSLLKEEKPKLCFNCHSEFINSSRLDHQHDPFKEDCFNCHLPHHSMNDYLLVDESKSLCLTCHDNINEEMNTKQVVHGVMKDEVSCIKCHNPHASNEPGMLKNKNKAVCLNCHNKEIPTKFGNIKDIKTQIDNSKHIHAPVEEGCIDCHKPHAADNPFLLSDFYAPIKYVPANTSNFELCFNCHDKQLMNSKRVVIITRFRNGNENLHYVHLQGKKARNCNLCHDVHASNQEHLIKTKSQFGQWEMPIEYKANLNGGTCLSGCHEKKEYKIIPDIE